MMFVMLAGAFLVGIIQILPMLLVFTFAACVSGLSITRAYKIPLYWIVAFLSLITAPVLPLFISVPVLFQSTEPNFDLPIYQLSSWPFATCLVGSLISLSLTYSKGELTRAISGCSWGLTAMFVVSVALAPKLPSRIMGMTY
jgi:hypothetical protein